MSDPQTDQGAPDRHPSEAVQPASSTLAELLDGLRAPQGPPPPIGHHASARSLSAVEREASSLRSPREISDG